ncbi:acyltransferase domain-containing protein [Crossiella sp. SN42]|uniref:acyltransferase domain-containing protein n=1 Tax=Crossiella sp. SN42 TaxID=2944808 RepID=UPI00207D4508|nr:acyltransferase domain-containing protein [Crossiella sp. SN42]MCO1576043.1 acyltransferase domain-containing protein [Crossiella sp. SN42]
MSTATARSAPPVVLLFPGQGAQHPRMAAGLYRHEPVFTAWMDRAFELFGADGSWLRAEWLAPEPSPMYHDVSVAQPLLYAVNHALGRMVLDWGVRPVALLGHSVGEMAAATLAGVLELADGIGLMTDRVAEFAATPPGGMLAVSASVEEVADVLRAGVHLAAVNAPRQLLLAGEREPLDRAARALTEREVVCRDVFARQAFHSPVVEQAVAATLPGWRAVRLREPRLKLYSAYTQGVLSAETARDPVFWARQAAETVYFAPTLTALLAEHGDCVLVEAGPGTSLSVLGRRQPSVVRGGGRVLPVLPNRHRGDQADQDATAAARRELLALSSPIPTA